MASWGHIGRGVNLLMNETIFVGSKQNLCLVAFLSMGYHRSNRQSELRAWTPHVHQLSQHSSRTKSIEWPGTSLIPLGSGTTCVRVIDPYRTTISRYLNFKTNSILLTTIGQFLKTIFQLLYIIFLARARLVRVVGASKLCFCGWHLSGAENGNVDKFEENFLGTVKMR